ncbi:MAG: HAD-IIB family hydrolase [Tissierellia bacterium]|nr:HAD-IIB family hydrolase [Tissierellia bacterium]
MYRIVAMDLDQTLLSRDKKLMGDFNRFVNSCTKNNIIPIIATGRGYHSAKHFIPQWPLNIVCNNGNLIRNEQKGSIEYINPIPKADVRDILYHQKNERIQTSFHINGYDDGKDLAQFPSKDTKYQYRSREGKRNIKLKRLEDLSYDILSVVFTGEKEDLRQLELELSLEYQDRFNLHLMAFHTRDCHMLEVLQRSGDKYIGVREFAQKRNIQMSEVIAIGDDSNDRLLIEKAGLGIAMKNGVKEVRRVADIVSHKTNDEGGALDILNKVLKFGD